MYLKVCVWVSECGSVSCRQLITHSTGVSSTFAAGGVWVGSGAQRVSYAIDAF